MSDFSRLSRRKFLVSAGTTAAGAILLKGCTQPSTSNSTAQSPAPSPVTGADAPEVTKATLGYLPIVESAPLIIAKEKGFFAKYGMTDVAVVKQANWAGARDNVVLGSSAGGIDGGQWQMPMPHLITEGIITNGNKLPMSVLLQLNTNGNAIAIAAAHEGKGLGLKINDPEYVKQFQAKNGRLFKAAYTFPNANQDFWIRYWFAASGVDPDKDIELLAVPPAETVQGMRNGTMDAFSTGDPWPYRIISDEIGFLSTLTTEMWPYHPEEYFALRTDWIEANPKATKALLKGIMEAQQWCDDEANREELVKIVAARSFFNAPSAVLTPPFKGNYAMGDGKAAINEFKFGPMYWKDPNGDSISYPFKSHDLWFLTESLRWGFHKSALTDLDVVQKLVERVNREDLWREAAKEAGFTADIPASTSRGVETFFDGIKFDPENPQRYLDDVKIKAA